MQTERDLDRWIADLEARHLRELTFAEVSRSLRALSATYVESRHRLGRGAALSGAGKRAAFALFYGPLHFLLVREIAAKLAGKSNASVLVDLGCGSGAAGAACAIGSANWPKVVGIDRHPWAVKEAVSTYRAFGLAGRARVGDVSAVELPTGPAAFVAAFVLNELPDESRDRLLRRLIDRAQRGDHVLIVEPLAGFVAPWWGRWQQAVEDVGGRSDEWRVRAPLPEIVLKLDRAAGLNHREITGRSLWLGG